MSNSVKTQPTVEPVSAAELGVHLRLHSDAITAETDYLETLISAARQLVELETGLALITQTWTYTLDRMPSKSTNDDWWDGVREGAIGSDVLDYIELPTHPLQSVTSVTTYDSSDVGTVMSSTLYRVDTRSKPGRVALRSGSVWPLFTRLTDGLEIDYVVGYGDTSADVPASLRQAVMIIAADWYENRESIIIGTISSKLQGSVDMILEKFRTLRV